MNNNLERKNLGKQRTGIERLLASLSTGTARLLASRRVGSKELMADTEKMQDEFARLQAESGRHQDGVWLGGDLHSDLHLSDEQFAELLLGEIPCGAEAHLATCAQCSEEAERVLGAIGDFARQSRLWAERRTASQPRLASGRKFGTGGRLGLPEWLLRPQIWLLRPQAWLAAALTFVLVGGVGVSRHGEAVRGGQAVVATALVPVAQTAVATTETTATRVVAPATLKADNELLSAIDGELRADDSSAVELYGLNVDAREDRSLATKRISD